jgi:hypothetical protein
MSLQVQASMHIGISVYTILPLAWNGSKVSQLVDEKRDHRSPCHPLPDPDLVS